VKLRGFGQKSMVTGTLVIEGILNCQEIGGIVKDLPAGMAILQASVTAKELFQDLVPWQHLGLTSSSDDQLE
jgi:hypothetical protein